MTVDYEDEVRPLNEGEFVDPVGPIGFLIWWSLEESITYATVNAAFRTAGMDVKGFLRRPRTHLSLRRACERVEKLLRARIRDGAAERYMLRPITSKNRGAASWTHYALLHEQLTDKGLESAVTAEIRCEVDEDPVVTSAQDDDVIQEIMAWYKQERDYCSGTNISRVLVEIVGKQGRGMPVSDTGGVYWVPWWDHERQNLGLRALRKIFSVLTGSRLSWVVTYGDAHTKRQLGNVADVKLLDDVARLEKLIKRWTGFKKKSLIDTGHKRLLPIRKKIEMYERRLGRDYTHVKRRCDEVAELVERKLNIQVKKRERLQEPPAPPTIEDGFTIRQREMYTKAREGILAAVERNDPYLRNICDVALAAVAKDCGVDAANEIIEEFALTSLINVRKIEERRDER